MEWLRDEEEEEEASTERRRKKKTQYLFRVVLSTLTFPASAMSTCSSFSSDRLDSTSATPTKARLRLLSSWLSSGGPKGESSGDSIESVSRGF